MSHIQWIAPDQSGFCIPYRRSVAPRTRLRPASAFRGIFTLGFSIALLLLTDFNPVQAQARFGNFGIETPSQRFFREGREQLEQEIHRLQTPPASEPRLTIDDDAYIQDDLIQLEDPRLHPQHSPSGSSRPQKPYR